MRALSAKLLAGDVAQPGSFSRRTLDVVRNLSTAEVDAFNRLSLNSFEFARNTWLAACYYSIPIVLPQCRAFLVIVAGYRLALIITRPRHMFMS